MLGKIELKMATKHTITNTWFLHITIETKDSSIIYFTCLNGNENANRLIKYLDLRPTDYTHSAWETNKQYNDEDEIVFDLAFSSNSDRTKREIPKTGEKPKFTMLFKQSGHIKWITGAY